MKIKFIILIIFFFVTSTTFSQYGGISFSVNYNTYNNSDLIDFQNELKKDIDLPVTITDNYPNYWGYKIGYQFPEFFKCKIVFFYSKYSTGGKLSYADYSGSYSMKQNLKTNNFGSSLILPSKLKGLNYMVTGLISSTSFKMEEKLSLNSEIEKYNYDFSSLSLGLDLGFQYELDLYFAKIDFSIEYSLYVPSKLYYSNDSEIYLVGSDGNTVRVNWSGLRLNTGVLIPLFPWNKN